MYEYDLLGRLKSVVYGQSARVDFVYDLAGNLIEERINGAAGIGLSVSSAPANSGTIQLQPQKSSYVAGDVVTATAIPSVGFNFANWSGLPACTTASVCTFTMPGSSVSLTANFQAATSGTYQLRTLAAPSVGGTVTAPNPAGYAAGAAVSLTATPAAGYVVDYWYGAACTNFSGAVCNFNMPAQNADVFVRFKPASGSGYALNTYAAFFDGVAGNPLAAGMASVSPGTGNIAAGTPVTLAVHTATGFRFASLQITNGTGASRNDLCPSITLYGHMPWQVPTCTFNMPDEPLDVTTRYEPFPEHFALDLGVTPANAGVVQITTADAPNSLEHYLDWSVTPNRRMVQGGLQTTLTAKHMGSRRFLKWANGPCAESTDPVCTFVMPQSATLSNPVFSDEPASGCTFALTRSGSGVFRATGGSMTLNIATQEGCHFNAELGQHYASLGTLNVGASSVTLNLPAKAETYPTAGQVSLFLGRELVVIPFVQLGANDLGITDLPAVDLSLNRTAFTGEQFLNESSVTITNNTAQSQALRKPQTIGPFALKSSTCTSSLAAGASCTVDLQFNPVRPGAYVGEFQMAGTTVGWRAVLSGTGVQSRVNVAAAVEGGSIEASSRLDDFAYSEQALINGDLRGEPVNAQGIWAANGPSQNLVVRFAGLKKVNLVSLIGYDSGVAPFLSETPQGEPSPNVDKPANSINIQSFNVEYWDGTAWVPVVETSEYPSIRVDAPKRWLQVAFEAVQTDRVRVNVVGALGTIRASEVMVWTEEADRTADPFFFEPKYEVTPSQYVTSNIITPVGFNAPTTITANGFSIGCTSSITSGTATINPGDSVCIKHVAAPAGGIRSTSVNIGGQTAVFTTYSRAAVLPPDTAPDPIASQVRDNVEVNVPVVFASVSITGIDAAVPLSVVGGQFSLGCTGSYLQTATVSGGETLCVRQTSSPNLGASVSTVLTVGSGATVLNVSFTSTTRSETPPDLTITPMVGQGWNLLGNGLNQAIPVAVALADANVVTSVWKWDAAADRWLFYTPLLDSVSLEAYVSRRGYGVLTEVLPGEGYWVNAKAQAALAAQSGQPVVLTTNQLLSGWNLVATGTNPSPSELVAEGALTGPPGSAGSSSSVISLWAWNTELQQWYLYAPSLADRGQLQQYLSGRGYLDFTQGGRTLAPGTGFWVNRH